jgi:hypothetical protein
MAKLLKLRRGTTSQHSSFTGAEGEVTVDTDKEALVVHNGSQAGGFPVARADGTGTANFTITGELDAATLDISGNADIDGTLEADAYTVDGTALNEYIADTVGAMVTGNTETGITVTYQDSDNTLDFATSGTASTATEATNVTVVANNSTDETVYPTFVDGATGTQGIETDTGLTYNPSTGLLTAGALTLTGNLTVNGTTTTVATTNTTVTDNLLELNSGAGSNANDCGILIERGSTGDNAIIAWDESADKFIVGTTTGTASSTGDITIAAGTLVTSTVEDSKGELRTIPQLSKSSAHTIVAGDAGQHSINSSGGWVINTSTGFTAGQAITLINNSSGDQTITSTGVTLYNSADGSTPTKIATRGMATVICTASNVYYISGAGLS